MNSTPISFSNTSLPFADCTYFVQTFGCQMNKHDSERVCGLLEAFGATYVETVEEADIVVFMTCCVREKADVRLYGQVASMKNIPLREGSPLEKRLICVGGCVGQRDGYRLIEQLPHLDVVFGTHNIGVLPLLLMRARQTGEHQVETVEEASSFPTDLPTVREIPWAAWLPINVGCDNFCTYCIVPYVRGREKSRHLDDIVAEAKHYVDEGVKEITLLGQNVNSYGRDIYGEARFEDVIDAVAATGIERLRFTTSHPKDLNDAVIERFGTLENLMPALHLPVQSGSNRVLKAMGRSYTVEHYKELVAKVRKACPNIALSTDIIVGFSGETQEDFEATRELVKEIGYNQVFTFIYSKRAGTPAADMEDNTPKEVIQERFDSLVDEVQEGAFLANQKDLNTVVSVLIEGTSKRDDNIMVGRSPKNQTVHAEIPEGVSIDTLRGSIVEIAVDEAKTWYLKGELLNPEQYR